MHMQYKYLQKYYPLSKDFWQIWENFLTRWLRLFLAFYIRSKMNCIREIWGVQGENFFYSKQKQICKLSNDYMLYYNDKFHFVSIFSWESKL